MAKVVTIELQAKTKEAQRELDLINKEIEEQKELTIELQKEQLRLEEQLKRTPKNAIGAQKRLKSEIQDLGLAIKDNNIGLRQLNLERSKVTKTTSKLAKGTKSLTDRVSQNYGVTGLLNTLTGGLASRYRDAYTAVTGLSVGLKGLRAALLATGIGAIVVAVGLLAANWEKVTDFLSGTTEEQKKYNEAVKEGNKAAYEATQTLKNLRDIALDESASTRSREQALKDLAETVTELNEVSLDQEDALQKITEATEPYIQAAIARAKADAFAKLIAEEELALLEKRKEIVQQQENLEMRVGGLDFDLGIMNIAPIKLFTEGLQEIDKAYTGFAVDLMNKDLEKSEKNIEMLQEEFRGLIGTALEFENINEETEKKVEKRSQDAKDRQTKKERDDEQAVKNAQKAARDEAQAKVDLINTIAEIEQQNLDRVLTNEQLEKNAVLDKFFTLTEAARQAGIDTTIIEEEKQAQLAEIDKKYADIRKKQRDKDAAEAKAVEDAKIAMAKSTLGNISKAVGENSRAGKAAAAAAALINTYQGISAELATKTVTPFGFALKLANIAATAAIGFKSVKDIMKTNPKATGGAGAASAGTESSSGSAPTPTEATASIPPAFNIVGASGTNQLAEAIGGQAQQPVKAFVVSNDVSTAQELDRNIVEGASIG